MAHSHDDHQHPKAGTLTRNQGLVLDTLQHAESPLSAYDILDRLRVAGLRAPLQVYRALEKLIDAGLAHRLESLNAFVCCADSRAHRGGATAFAICGSCGRVEEFADPLVNARLGAWADTIGFTAAQSTIELRGRCRDCAAVVN